MSVEELVEDKVVKSAIERWRKECWVRFLLEGGGGGGSMGGDVDESERSGGVRSVGCSTASGSSGGGYQRPALGTKSHSVRSSFNMDEIMKGEGGLHELECLKGKRKGGGNSSVKGHLSSQVSNASSKSGGGAVGKVYKLPKAIKDEDDVKSHSSRHSKKSTGSSSKAAGKQKNPPPPPRKGKTPPPPSSKSSSSKLSRDKSGGGKGRQQRLVPRQSSKRSEITSSDVTAVASNTRQLITPSSTPLTSNSHKQSATASGGGVPQPPFLSSVGGGSTTAASSSSSPPVSPVATTSPRSQKSSHKMAAAQAAAGSAPPLTKKSSNGTANSSANIVPGLIPVNLSSAGSTCSDVSNPYDMFGAASYANAATTQPRIQHNGWSVPLGVHKVISSAPGLNVTAQIHRRSPPVKVRREVADVDTGATCKVRGELIIPPGSYVEILETEVHGDRVRGRICWEEEEEDEDAPRREKEERMKRNAIARGSHKVSKRTSRLLKRTAAADRKRSAPPKKMKLVRYEGWISLQWAKSEEERGQGDSEDGMDGSGRGKKEKVADEDAGPWTEPVPLGVYRINFGGGLPLRETPERDSTVLGKLDRGRCVEVVQTEVKGDRVRARVIVPSVPQQQDEEGESSNRNVKFTSGWISLLNALTGSSGASPVPLGA